MRDFSVISQQSSILLSNACLVNHDGISKEVNVVIEEGSVSGVGKPSELPSAGIEVDLSGKYLYPGLINAHDHLVGEWTPRVGRNRPYVNAEEWQVDFLDEKNPCRDYVEKRTVMDENIDAIIWLGIYKNLFSGVTLVSDHFHYDDGSPTVDSPIRIVEKFTQCHSIYWGNFWGGEECEEEFNNAGGEMPFIIHIGEGTDQRSKDELTKLNDMGCLDSNTLLIHGITFDESDAELLAEKGASLVWCPDSNEFLIGVTANIPILMDKGVNIALGTDSSMSGSQSLFEEIAMAKKLYRRMAGEDISDRTLFNMISKNAASALFVENAGSVQPGGFGDLLVMESLDDDPYKSLSLSSARDIHLLICRGLPILMDAAIAAPLRHPDIAYTPVKVDGKEMLVAGDPFKPVNEISEILGYSKKFDFLPFEH